MKTIAVFGDSILKGAVTGLSDHLFDVLEENSLSIAQKKLGFELHNDSVFGSIITKSQKRLNKFFEKGGKADIVIIESGGNDSDYDWSLVSQNPDNPEISPKVPLNDYIRILNEMVQTVKTNGALPVIMTMPSLVADRWFTHICRGQNESNIKKFLGECPPDKLGKFHEMYNLNLMEYCITNNIFMVDMRKAFLETPDYRKLMCLDGIHPNQKGYEFMATVWEKSLPEIL
ncbi:MAG: SGNH/GDSL hydrolase family protein [Treponema sp.]|nr:SGNH/GDSL hydrolase family protein [Treponema sp.]